MTRVEPPMGLRDPKPPNGLCGNKDDHAPHLVERAAIGTYWCHADQTKRLPWALERRG